MNTSQANTKSDTPYRGLTALFSAFALVALPAAAPGALGDCACECQIEVERGEELTITQNRTADCVCVYGTLNIAPGITLTLHGANGNGASTIRGTVNLQYDPVSEAAATLAFIDNDHELKGNGDIVGADHACKITLGSNNLDLISQIKIAGALRITEAGTPSSTSFTNGAKGVVDADSTGTLEIVTIDSLAAGSGQWRVTGSGMLRFSVAATGESGAFTVSAGTLDVRESVCTTGDLSFTGGTIDVASGKSFKAGCASCP